MDPISKEYVDIRIKQFKKRAQGDRDFCEQLYAEQTIRVLGAKYAYYKSGHPIFSDLQYDGEERDWYIMGRALGYLKEDETSPCVGFDEGHPRAQEAIEFSKTIKPYTGSK